MRAFSAIHVVPEGGMECNPAADEEGGISNPGGVISLGGVSSHMRGKRLAPDAVPKSSRCLSQDMRK